MLIQESLINETEGHYVYDGDPYKPFTDNVGELFKSLQKEYGRCISRLYYDTDGETKVIGWVFEKRAKYEDSEETYLQHAWITLYDKWERQVASQLHYI